MYYIKNKYVRRLIMIPLIPITLALASGVVIFRLIMEHEDMVSLLEVIYESWNMENK